MCSSDLAALITGLKVLSQGECLGIYPEGTRSPDGRLYKGRTGIARLALESGAPIVPVAMYNTAEIQPTGQVVPKVRRVEMVFGEPMFFSGESSDQELLREITDQVMMKIQELSAQEYVPIYASDAKELISQGKKVPLDFKDLKNFSANKKNGKLLKFKTRTTKRVKKTS